MTRAAVLYVFRLMVEAPIPMNAGCLKPIRIVIPDGCMLKPAYPAAVVAGNTETSQHVTNCLLQALGALHAAQRPAGYYHGVQILRHAAGRQQAALLRHMLLQLLTWDE